MDLLACRVRYKEYSWTCSLFRTRIQNFSGAVALMEKDFPNDFYSFDLDKLKESGVIIDYYKSF